MMVEAIGRGLNVGKLLACKHDRDVALSQRLQPVLDLAGEEAVFQEEPGFIENEQARLSVEPPLECVKERAEHRSDRGGPAHEVVHLEGLHAGSLSELQSRSSNRP